jgi:hypothetical protein
VDLGHRTIKIDDLSFISYLENRPSHGADLRVLRDEEIGGIDKGNSRIKLFYCQVSIPV